MTQTNKYLEKIATVSVQHHNHRTTDKALAKQNTTYSLVGGAVGPIGLAANIAHNYASGRDTTGGLREYGRGKITGAARGLGEGVVGAGVGGAIGAGIGALAKNHKAGTAIGAGIGAAAGLIHGGIKGEYNGRLASIRNQISEGRLKNVEKTAEFTEPDTDEKLKRDVAAIGTVKLDAVQGKTAPAKGMCTPDKECLDKAAGIVDSLLASKGAGKLANAGIKGFNAVKAAPKIAKVGLGLGATAAAVGAGAAMMPKNNQ